MGKRIIALAVSVFIMLGLSSCNNSSTVDKDYIAVIAKSVNSDFFSNMKNGAESSATEYNVRITFEGPENEEDYKSQNNLIKKAVSNGAKAILLSSIDYNASNSEIERAVQRGVKVITIDSGVSSDSVSQFIGTDNKQAGTSAANAAVSGFKNDEQIYIGIINCTEDTDTGKRREDGFREALKNNDNVKYITTVMTQSNVESAKNGALRLLKENPRINVLVGFNEWLTLGVGEAIKEIGAASSVKGIGFDTNVKSVSMLETGEMDVLIAQNPFAMGYLGIKNAATLISGGILGEREMYTSVISITKENMFDSDVQKVLFRFN